MIELREKAQIKISPTAQKFGATAKRPLPQWPFFLLLLRKFWLGRYSNLSEEPTIPTNRD